MDKLLRSLFVILFLCGLSVPAQAIKTIPGKTPNITYGVGSHIAVADTDIATKMALMRTYGMTTLRFDLNMTASDNPTGLLDAILALSPTYGVTLHPIIFTAYHYGDATDNGAYPAGDHTALYNQAYNRTFNIVSVYGDRIRDWEYNNETNLLGGFKSGSGVLSSDYATTLAGNWAAAFAGFSDAILAVKAAHPSWNVRSVADFTYIDFGFVPFLEANGSHIDKIAYHYYYDRRTVPTAISGNGTTYNILAQFASIGKPVIINEFNAGEVYDPTNNTLPYTPSLAELGLATHLQLISSQSTANIEGVEMYELFDEPAKASPEDNFGLYHDATTSKIQLLIAAHFAGATLSSADSTKLINATKLWSTTRSYPLSGLTVWYESNSPESVTNTSGVVSAWKDKSLNGYTATASGTAQPTTGTATANGYNGIQFDGTTDQMNIPSGVWTFPSNTDSTMIIVYKGGTDGTRQLVSCLDGSGNRYRLRQLTGQYTFEAGVSGSGPVINHTFDTNPHVIIGRKQGATITVALDGSGLTASNTAGATFTASAGCFMGSQQLSSFADGSFYDIKMYSRYLSDAELNVMGGKYATKYGLTWTNF